MFSKRIVVSGACAKPCASCQSCDPAMRPPPLEALLSVDEPELVLGGGDATRWPQLDQLLCAAAALPSPKMVWVEAPAEALQHEVLERLVSLEAHGVVVQTEATGAALRLALPGGVVAEAEALGLKVRVRLRAGAATFAMVVPVARQLAPRQVTFELSRLGPGGKPILLSPEAVDLAFAKAPNLTFEYHRLERGGYLPPCALPNLHAARPEVWRTLLAEECGHPNRIFEACSACDLATRCRFRDPGALGRRARSRLSPPARLRPSSQAGRRSPVPRAITALRTGPEIPCIAPWTVMEIVDPVGLMNHCCADWTVGSRGNARMRELLELWNGPNYRAARRRMLGLDPGLLCRPICPRLHDRRFAEHDLQIIERSPRFVENQLMLAEDLARRREVVRAKPLYITLCPTTYCNYDCIMCAYGRLPRRDLPASVLEQLDAFLPTLRTLTLLGGEPLASRAVMELLRRFDREKYPDGGVDLVTNGSLLTGRALENLGACAFGAVVISLNAGNPEAYQKIHRGVPMATVLDNLDALLRHRERYGFFGITLSCVVQPASSGGLVEFGKIALDRGLDIRLLPLTPSSADLDFYGCEETVAEVLDDLQAFERWAGDRNAAWLKEIFATRDAVRREASRRLEERGTGAASVLSGARVAQESAGLVESAAECGADTLADELSAGE